MVSGLGQFLVLRVSEFGGLGRVLEDGVLGAEGWLFLGGRGVRSFLLVSEVEGILFGVDFKLFVRH